MKYFLFELYLTTSLSFHSSCQFIFSLQISLIIIRLLDRYVVELTHNWSAEQWDWPLQHNDEVIKVTNTNDKFEVGLDASFFTPKEIEVKVAGDNLVIHCRHESRAEHYGEIKREISRTYKLPSDVDTKTLTSNLTKQGHLVIAAKKKA
uniref:Small heat shock protein n=1 Tax=Wuchereria bancrofti TaxID=6293 RepID=A0AAF5RUL3_WUCBA